MFFHIIKSILTSSLHSSLLPDFVIVTLPLIWNSSIVNLMCPMFPFFPCNKFTVVGDLMIASLPTSSAAMVHYKK